MLKDAADCFISDAKKRDETAFGANDDHFAGLDVTLIDGANQVEGAGLRGENDGVAASAPPLGMRPMDSGRKPRGSRMAKTRSRVIITRENAPSIRRRRRTRLPAALFLGLRDQMHDHFSVAGGLEDGSLRFKALADFIGVDQVAVMRQSNHALVAIDHDGLRVEHSGIAGGGVARMSDSQIAGKLLRTSSVKISATSPMALCM